jgi:hypothetical protein
MNAWNILGFNTVCAPAKHNRQRDRFFQLHAPLPEATAIARHLCFNVVIVSHALLSLCVRAHTTRSRSRTRSLCVRAHTIAALTRALALGVVL